MPWLASALGKRAVRTSGVNRRMMRRSPTLLGRQRRGTFLYCHQPHDFSIHPSRARPLQVSTHPTHTGGRESAKKQHRRRGIITVDLISPSSLLRRESTCLMQRVMSDAKPSGRSAEGEASAGRGIGRQLSFGRKKSRPSANGVPSSEASGGVVIGKIDPGAAEVRVESNPDVISPALLRARSSKLLGRQLSFGRKSSKPKVEASNIISPGPRASIISPPSLHNAKSTPQPTPPPPEIANDEITSKLYRAQTLGRQLSFTRRKSSRTGGTPAAKIAAAAAAAATPSAENVDDIDDELNPDVREPERRTSLVPEQTVVTPAAMPSAENVDDDDDELNPDVREPERRASLVPEQTVVTPSDVPRRLQTTAPSINPEPSDGRSATPETGSKQPDLPMRVPSADRLTPESHASHESFSSLEVSESSSDQSPDPKRLQESLSHVEPQQVDEIVSSQSVLMDAADPATGEGERHSESLADAEPDENESMGEVEAARVDKHLAKRELSKLMVKRKMSANLEKKLSGEDESDRRLKAALTAPPEPERHTPASKTNIEALAECPQKDARQVISKPITKQQPTARLTRLVQLFCALILTMGALLLLAPASIEPLLVLPVHGLMALQTRRTLTLTKSKLDMLHEAYVAAGISSDYIMPWRDPKVLDAASSLYEFAESEVPKWETHESSWHCCHADSMELATLLKAEKRLVYNDWVLPLPLKDEL